MSGNIFINYRRGDEPGFTQALVGRLEQVFSAERLFIDVDHIPPGEDFVRVLEAQVAQCDVLLAVIGKGWLDAADGGGHRRLDDPNDFVRVEIESALKLGKRVIPVLVNDAHMPRADQMPEALRPLATRNAVRLTHERFRADVQGLVGALQRGLAGGNASSSSISIGPAPRRSLLIASIAAVVIAIAGIVWFSYSRPKPPPSTAESKPPAATAPASQPANPPAPQPTAQPAPSPAPQPIPAPAPQPAPAAPVKEAVPVRPPRPHSATEACATFMRSGDSEQYCASSVLAAEAGNSYSVDNLFSANPTTAWVHGTHKSGAGQWIVVEFDGWRAVKSVTVRNGYQKNADIFEKNSRVRQLRLAFSQGESKVVSLEDRLGDQTIVLDQPIKAYWIEFVVEDVFAGSKYPDTAISKLFVTSEAVR
jgi:TIR domain